MSARSWQGSNILTSRALSMAAVAYCRERNSDLESRLRLFLRVCEAVSYAHRALVVHRDLKPNNILVSGEGIPKLLDFGVAKLLDPGADPRLTSTSFAMVPLTPAYASPEQVRGLSISPVVDVYALGAILFELLTGTCAQKINTHTPSEIERVVCQTEVQRPSVAVRAAGLPRWGGPRRHHSNGDAQGERAPLSIRGSTGRRYRALSGRPISTRAAKLVRISHPEIRGSSAIPHPGDHGLLDRPTSGVSVPTRDAIATSQPHCATHKNRRSHARAASLHRWFARVLRIDRRKNSGMA